MEVVLVLLPFVLLGVGVLFVAFSGGPGAAREAYLTRAPVLFRVGIPLVYLVLGIAVPAVVIAGREESRGGVGRLEEAKLTTEQQRGKELFRQQCSSCHTLAAVNARGVTGPNLDDIGQVTKARVVSAIKRGGTGQRRMPANLLPGEDAEAVGAYVAKVAGQ